MERAYYIVKNGAIKDALIEQSLRIESQRKETFARVKTLSAEIGCLPDEMITVSNKFAGFIFESMPNFKFCGWKHVNNGWYPKKNTANGKRIANAFSEFKAMKLTDALPKEPCFGFLFSGMRMHQSGAYKLDDIFLVSIPFDEMKSVGPDLYENSANQLERITPLDFSSRIDAYNEKAKAGENGNGKGG